MKNIEAVFILMNQHYIELSLVSISVALVVFYHIYLVFRVHSQPQLTAIGRNNYVRLLWVQTVMDERRDILAVQTLRNWTMAATFLASTAIIISLGSLSMALTTEKLAEVTLSFNFLGTQSKTLWVVKLLLLSVNFFITFFNFMLAVRYYNHVPFLITVAPGKDAGVTADATAQVVNRAAKFNTFGMRGYYFSIPLALWLLGPSWMLSGSVVLVVLLYFLDRNEC